MGRLDGNAGLTEFDKTVNRATARSRAPGGEAHKRAQNLKKKKVLPTGKAATIRKQGF